MKGNVSISKNSDLYSKNYTDSLLPTNTVTGNPVIAEKCLEASKIVNCKIYGNLQQDGTPTPDTPVELQCVGDLVSDESSEYYGKYSIPITVEGSDEVFNIYLDTPLCNKSDVLELDATNKKATLTHRYCYYTITGDEEISKEANDSYPGGHRYRIKYGWSNNLSDGRITAPCNRFKVSTAWNDYSDNMAFVYGDSVFIIYSAITDVASLRTFFRTNETNILIRYPEPVVTDISDKIDWGSVPKLPQDPTTLTVGTALQPSNVEVTYYQDARKLIAELQGENKWAEVMTYTTTSEDEAANTVYIDFPENTYTKLFVMIDESGISGTTYSNVRFGVNDCNKSHNANGLMNTTPGFLTSRMYKTFYVERLTSNFLRYETTSTVQLFSYLGDMKSGQSPLIGDFSSFSGIKWFGTMYAGTKITIYGVRAT